MSSGVLGIHRPEREELFPMLPDVFGDTVKDREAQQRVDLPARDAHAVTELTARIADEQLVCVELDQVEGQHLACILVQGDSEDNLTDGDQHLVIRRDSTLELGKGSLDRIGDKNAALNHAGKGIE